ncbi:MAG: hypothetical protein EHM32_12690 [Spirochaetales bacterium]|nr:MAG: hypothetical protein EHM32_12690 [Spirochaetales bacterium]
MRICPGIAGAILLTTIAAAPAFSWSNHTMLSHPALSGLVELTDREPVVAQSLKSFLLREEKGLEKLLADEEGWARKNMPGYEPRPDNLAFRATGDPKDVLGRFLQAARLNPGIKPRLYLQLLPGEKTHGRPVIDPGDLATLKDTGFMEKSTYVRLKEGEKIAPLEVLTTANDEPDYGFDLGLFTDNNTAYGKVYGFGIQPFGNPNLEYGSQAPFHMGFYHEPKIIYFFAPFLKRTYPEYRIHLFKSLSEYAFRTGNDYWGWRFMGWGMHYLGDLSMPYHAKPLPGVSALRMIWINLKAMLGFAESKNGAIQLVSNRHTILEEFQENVLRKAYDDKNPGHPLFQALRNPLEVLPYGDDFPRRVVAKESAMKSGAVDAQIEKYFPERLISDPSFEASGSKELGSLIEYTVERKGRESVDQMTLALADLFKSYGMHIRSYLNAIREASKR